jgi:hypothetical protein
LEIIPVLHNSILDTFLASPVANMSDYEDEMDVDAPAPSHDIAFSSAAKQGKRSAANLPIEAEDNLPW